MSDALKERDGMQTKLLVKMVNDARSLEKIMAAVRASEFTVRNFNARLSLDEKVFFLTMEVVGTQPSSALSHQLNAMTEVTSVEVSN